MKHKKHILILTAFSLVLFFASCKKEYVEPNGEFSEEVFTPSASNDILEGGINELDTTRMGLYIDKKTKKGSRSSKPNSKLLISSN